MQAIMKVYNWLDKLASEEQGFYAVMNFLRILYELSSMTMPGCCPVLRLPR